MRGRFDPAAALGVGAHVTVLYPFLPVSHLGDGLFEQLAGLAAGHPAFDLRLSRLGRFPGVVYLAVEPEGPVRRLTDACAARWPDHPPYGGVFDDVVPHLTIGHGEDDLAAEAEASITPRLPIAARVDALSLVVFDGERWRVDRAFPLGE